jgi:anthranilate 1,2-dioxygenase small subunit
VSLREEVEALYTDYVECLDGDELERWPDFFTDDCRYEIVPKENQDLGLPLALVRCESRAMLVDRVEALRGSAVFEPRQLRHLWSGLVVEAPAADGSIPARASFALLQTLAGDVTRLFLAGRWLDRLVRDGGRLRFRRRLCVIDSDLVPGSLVHPV